MRKIRWWLDTCKVDEVYEGEFEVEDNATEEEIEYEARQEAFNCIEWGYEEIREPVSFMKLLEKVEKEEEDGETKFRYDNKSHNYTFKGSLDEFLTEISRIFTASYVTKILTNGRFYIYED